MLFSLMLNLRKALASLELSMFSRHSLALLRDLSYPYRANRQKYLFLGAFPCLS